MPGESLSGWKSRAAGVPGGLTAFIAETGVHLGDISIKDRGPGEKLLPEKVGFVGAAFGSETGAPVWTSSHWGCGGAGEGIH